MKNSSAIIIGQALLLLSTTQALQFKFPKEFTIGTEITIGWVGQPSLGTSEQSVVLFKDNEAILALCYGFISGSGQCSFTLFEDDIKTLERGNDGYYIGLQGADGLTLDVSKEFKIQSPRGAEEEEKEEDIVVKVAHNNDKKKMEQNKDKKESKKKHTHDSEDNEDDKDELQFEITNMNAQEKPIQSPLAALPKATSSDASATVAASVLPFDASASVTASSAAAPAAVATEAPNDGQRKDGKVGEKNGAKNDKKGSKKGGKTEGVKSGDTHKKGDRFTDKVEENNDNSVNNNKKGKKQQEEATTRGADAVEDKNTNKDKDNEMDEGKDENDEDENEPWASVMNRFSSFGKTVESALSDGVTMMKQFMIADSQGQGPKAQKETDEL
ncbi:hypothetical protein BGZ50_005442 [Haplosporangium sp. Z 11]|nr:hypothetical protein BGZ50_005442 [Haplosporangium sp. Z 11]